MSLFLFRMTVLVSSKVFVRAIRNQGFSDGRLLQIDKAAFFGTRSLLKRSINMSRGKQEAFVSATRLLKGSINMSDVNEEESLALDVHRKHAREIRDHQWDQLGSTGGHFFQRKRPAGRQTLEPVRYKDVKIGSLVKDLTDKQVYVVISFSTSTPDQIKVRGVQEEQEDQINLKEYGYNLRRFSFYGDSRLCTIPYEGIDPCLVDTLVLVNGPGYDHPDAKLPDAKRKDGVPNRDWGLLFGTVVQSAASMHAEEDIRVKMAGKSGEQLSEEQWHEKWHDARGFGMVPRKNVVALAFSQLKASLEMPSQAKYLWTFCGAASPQFGQMNATAKKKKAGDVVSQEVLDNGYVLDVLGECQSLQSVLNKGYIREAAEGQSVWRCTRKGGVDIRWQPELTATKIGQIGENEIFAVAHQLTKKVEGVSITFLRVVPLRGQTDGGWVFDQDLDGEVCVEASQATYLWTECAAESATLEDFRKKWGQITAGGVVPFKSANFLQKLWNSGYIREAEQRLTVNFSPPGNIGIKLREDGRVTRMFQGQAQEQGVKVGTYVTRIGGQQFSVELLRAKSSGKVDYEVEFMSEAAESQSVWRCTWKGGVGIRSQPELTAPEIGQIGCNESFAVAHQLTKKVEGVNQLTKKVEGVSITFLELVDGRGWVFDKDLHGEVCVEANPCNARLEATHGKKLPKDLIY